jgi:flagellar biosynthesis protein FliQ
VTVEQVVHLSRLTLQAAFWVTLPVLGAATIVSLVISVVQVMTSIQDTTVITVPRLTAVGVILFLLLPWMLHRLLTFTVVLLADFRPYVR